MPVPLQGAFFPLLASWREVLATGRIMMNGI